VADPDLVAKARGGDRDAAEVVAHAIARDARSKREVAMHRMNVTVGTIAVVIFALVWMRSGLSASAFGLGLAVGIGVGIVAGVAIARRGQR
jgi:preprotein translocase subunit SecF